MVEEHAKKVADKLRKNVGFEVFTAVTMKNGVFWDEPHGVNIPEDAILHGQDCVQSI
jgi:hypothetical protein